MPLTPGVEAPGRIARPRQRAWGTLAASVPAGIEIDRSPTAGWPFANGVAVQSEGICGHVRVYSLDCDDPSGSTATDQTWGAEHAFYPLWMDVARFCATLGGRSDEEIVETNLAHLEADISYRLASELYLGTLTGSPAIVIDPVVITVASALPAHQAIELLEEHLASRHGNREAVFHVTPAMLTSLFHTSLVERDGTLYRLPTGHVVIGDAGYTGAAPSGDNITDENGDPVSPGALGDGEEYIYVTGPVAWDYGPELVMPVVDQGSAGARTNRRRTQVRRPGLAIFDPDCIHLAVLATLC